MDTWSSFVITADQRAKHDEQFALLNPVDGFLGRDQLETFFLKSRLPLLDLSQIWALSDIDTDGKMDRKEFSIAMFLITKRLDGMPLPNALPPGLTGQPGTDSSSRAVFVPSSHVLSTDRISSSTQSSADSIDNGFRTLRPAGNVSMSGQLPEVITSDSRITHAQPGQQQPTQSAWVMTAAMRAEYEAVFRKHVQHNQNYISGRHAKTIFCSSKLPLSTLADIWTLSDLDQDGNLNRTEFCIASFLIGMALRGVPLPVILPAGLLESEVPGSASPVDQSDFPDNSATIHRATFEDKRRENFIRGEAELERRRLQLDEQMQKEKEARLEKEREEQRQAEKSRLEKERQAAEDAERQAKHLADVQARRETSRQLSEESRHKGRLAADCQRQQDAERALVDRLLVECNQAKACRQHALAHQANLVESAGLQQQRTHDLESRISVAQASIDQNKVAIAKKRTNRDAFEQEFQELTEQVKAAKADLTLYQRKKQQLTLEMAMGADTNSAAEQFKTLQANREIHAKRIQQLCDQLASLDLKLTQQGGELAAWRNKEGESTHRSTALESELAKLRLNVIDLRNNVDADMTLNSNLPDIFESDKGEQPKIVPYEVMFDFEPRHPDELRLKTGSIVSVHAIPEVSVVSGWLYGELASGEKGLFPETYVREQVAGKIDPFDPFGVHKNKTGQLKPKPSTGDCAFQPAHGEMPTDTEAPPATPFYCRTLYPFDSKVLGDLHLAVNDIVLVHTVRDEWLEGTCQQTKKSGIFPANYCQRITDEVAQSLLSRLPSGYFTDSPSSSGSTTKTEVGASASSAAPTNQVVQPPRLSVFSSAPAASEPVNTAAAISQLTEPSALDSAAVAGAEDAAAVAGDTSPKPELARAIAPFTAISPEQLSLQLGQFVLVRKRSPNGWWEGELQQRGRFRQFGWFPANYVSLVSASSSPAVATAVPSNSSSAPGGATSAQTEGSGSAASATCSGLDASGKAAAGNSSRQKPSDEASATSAGGTATGGPPVEMMQAMFSYEAAHPDELSFAVDDVIVLLSRDEPQWWRGRLQNASASPPLEGLFPVNYVKPYYLPSAARSSPTDSQSSGNGNARVLTPSSSSLEDVSVGNPIPFVPCAELINPNDERNVELKMKQLMIWKPTSVRDHAIKEFLVSELNFYVHLMRVKEAYCELRKSGRITVQEMKSVFSNWEDLITFSKNIYFLLAQRLNHVSSPLCLNIGDILIDLIPEMEVFRGFCVRQSVSPTSFCQYVANIPALTNLMKQPFFMNFILLPMQRLTRYRLLLFRILDATSPDHPDYQNLRQALSMLQDLLNSINNESCVAQFAEYLKWLRPRLLLWSNEGDATHLRWFTSPTENLELLESGRFYKVSSNKQILGFLFRKYLLLAVLRKGSKGIFPIILQPRMNDTLDLILYKEPFALDQVLVKIYFEPAANVPDRLTLPMLISEYVEQGGESPGSNVTAFLSLYSRNRGHSDSDVTQASLSLSMRMAQDTNRERWIAQLNELTRR